MTAEARDPRERLVRDALEAYKDEYRELAENWRGLDVKAQGTIAIAGIFLAGLFAFVRELKEPTFSGELCLLASTVVLLALSILFSILELRIRAVSGAPVGEQLETLVNDLLSVEDGTSPERTLNYCRDQAEMWNAVNREVEDVNETKAGHLIKAQYILVAAIGLAALLTLIKVWN